MRTHRAWGWPLLAALALPLSAVAHATLDRSTPADGSTVATAPARITLMFSEPARLTAIGMQRADGHDVGPMSPVPEAAGRQFDIVAPKLGAGTYTLHYRALTPDDGHIVAGKITFTVGPAPAAGGAAAATGAVAQQGYGATGIVQRLDVEAGRVTIAHEAIAGLGWPAMTMTFAVKDTALYPRLEAGRHVQFTLTKQGALYVVTQVH